MDQREPNRPTGLMSTEVDWMNGLDWIGPKGTELDLVDQNGLKC